MSKSTRIAELAERIARQEAELEAQRAELEAAEAERDKRLAKALEEAGPARVALVEDLYEMFAVAPGTPRVNKRTGEPVLDKHGEPVVVRNDRDETKRTARLGEAIRELVERAGLGGEEAGVVEPVEAAEPSAPWSGGFASERA